MVMLGADIIIEVLLEEGVDTVFGYPGGAVIPLYDSIYKYRGKIRHILTAHEQGASHAADGYARSTGRVGVCIATSGPGATNLVTGLATAYMDSVPLVAITGNVSVSLLGKDSFQEVDITGITLPITKHNYIVKDIKDLASTLREAFVIAKEGRPGPVLVDIPKNVQTESYEFTPEKKSAFQRKSLRLREEALDRAKDAILSSERPLVYVGGGVIRSDASEELRAFLERIDAPACSSLMGLGAVPMDSPRFTGMVGMHGTKLSNMAVNRSDLLIVIGARFSDRVISKASEFASQARILQIDVDPAEFNKNISSDIHVICDIKVALEKLNSMIDEKLSHKRWMEFIAQSRKRYPQEVSSKAQRAREVIEALDELLPEKRIITTEVGQHQMWTAQFLKSITPRRFLTSGGLGTMGYGTGASIGAQIANPDYRVVNIAGDGSFRMNANELATIRRYNLPIIILVMNNHTLGMVRQWQNLFNDKHYSETTLDTPLDWVKLAEAYGIKGIRITLEDDVKKKIKEAIDLNEAVVIDCQIPTDDMVLPMVAPGASINNMMGFIDNES